MTWLMCMSVFPACMSVHHVHVPDTGGGQRASDPLQLELCKVVDWHLSETADRQKAAL